MLFVSPVVIMLSKAKPIFPCIFWDTIFTLELIKKYFPVKKLLHESFEKILFYTLLILFLTIFFINIISQCQIFIYYMALFWFCVV